jgi:parallel beta-helix repeat protein
MAAGIYINDVIGGELKLNNITDYNRGIFTNNCQNLVIEDNSCYRAKEYGAIYLYYTDNCIISDNSIYNSLVGDGIRLWDSDSNTLTLNSIYHCFTFGINLMANSDYNLIYHNNLIYNKVVGSQGYDVCKYNKWYKGSIEEGNYWSDWDGIDGYEILGSSGSVDLYPLSKPIGIEPDVSGLPTITLKIPIYLIPVTIFCILIVGCMKRKKIRISY